MAGKNLFEDNAVNVPINKGPARNLFAEKIQTLEPVQVTGDVPRETPVTESSPQPKEELGFIDRLTKDFVTRGEQFGKNISEVQTDLEGAGLNPFEAEAAIRRYQRRVAGAITGGAGDIIGEAVTSIGKTIQSFVPEAVREPLESIGTSLIESSFGKTVADALKGGAESFAKFEKEDPQTAQDVKDVFNIASFVAPTKIPTKAVKKVKATPDKVFESALTKGEVLTSDVFPPKTFVSKTAQKITERIPVVGTGGIRKAQQVSRIKALENIAKEFNIDPSSAFEKDIVESADRIFRGSQKRAGDLRKQAITELNKVGDFKPNKAVSEINTQISKIKDMGVRGDNALLGTLQNIKSELKGNFERMVGQRTTIFDDIADVGSTKSPIRSGGDAVLTRVASALSKDMDEFAIQARKTAGDNKALKSAAGKWKASNRIFKDNFAKAKDTELKRALTKGKVQPEVINSTIKGGKTSELTRLHGNIDLKGRRAVRQQILKNALEKADGNPTIFLNELKRVNNRKAINIFFRGKAKQELDGLQKFLDMTRRAQDAAASIATQQEVTTIGLVGASAINAPLTIGAGATIGLLGKAYESKAVRNLLIRLEKLPSGSKKARRIVDKLIPLVAVSAQTAKVNQENK